MIVEDGFVSQIYGHALSEGFNRRGHTVYRFEWFDYFEGRQYKNRITSVKDLIYKIQNKFRLGPILKKINCDFFNYACRTKPDLIFLYRNTHLHPRTLVLIKKYCPEVKIFCYNNDDPFSPQYPKYFWRLYFKCLKYCDHIFSYRLINMDEYRVLCPETPVSLLRSYYIENKNFWLDRYNNKYLCDVMFIGHFEDDGRDEYLKLLVDNGINLKIYGPEWKNSKYFNLLDKKCGPIKPIFEDYNLALNSTKIALVFLSKKNRDSYTRRNFEIPATKTFMMSERTDDLERLFVPDVEASFFSSKQELLEKIIFYLRNDDLRLQLAVNGYDKLRSDKHEVLDRCDQILQKVYIGKS